MVIISLDKCNVRSAFDQTRAQTQGDTENLAQDSELKPVRLLSTHQWTLTCSGVACSGSRSATDSLFLMPGLLDLFINIFSTGGGGGGRGSGINFQESGKNITLFRHKAQLYR